MQVKAKFVVNHVDHFAGGYRNVALSPITAKDTTSEEDKAFWDATPSGKLEMSLTRAATANFFEPGKTYYLTFEEAE